ncbi:hypothetical protein RUM44_006412 [Polyplax serrata]|uniref:L-type lectin-like domain-containing protein n=1 Tax=Polyplax serrata TaxID=468196 RepID=A0ABR1AI10_POLSC
MAAEVRWLVYVLLICFCSIFSGSNGTLPHRRFEYKYSFKPPYLAQKDGSVPFWQYGGNAIASADNVRIAPSLKSQKGAIWTKYKTNFKWWEVEIVFRITGRGRLGADGLAFWYTAERGSYDGTVFGSSDKWVGLGVMFDSFDNDNKHNNPFIMAVANDGTREFDHANDGSSQLLAGCLRDFRNKPFPTKAKIEYFNNVLTVLFHNGMTNNEQDYEMCLRYENVFLPEEGYFGLSAATGGLADDHDVIHFLTTSLHPPGQEPPPSQKVSVEEQQRLNQEYQEYQKKLEQQRDEYQREHPDAKKDKDEFAEWFESDNQRELRQIFSVQSQVFDVLKDLHRKLDEVIGRQERTLSLISQQPVAAGSPPGTAPQMIDTIRRHEVDMVLQNQNAIIQVSREIRGFIGEVHARSDQILQNQVRQPTAQVQSVGYDMASLVSEMRDGMNHVKQNLASLQRVSGQSQTTCPPCLSTTTFLIFIVIQLILMLGYTIYRDKQEQKAKKFY